MKLRKAIKSAEQVFIITTIVGKFASFQVTKKEVMRVFGEETTLLDEDLNNKEVWSWEDGVSPFFMGKDLYIRMV